MSIRMGEMDVRIFIEETGGELGKKRFHQTNLCTTAGHAPLFCRSDGVPYLGGDLVSVPGVNPRRKDWLPILSENPKKRSKGQRHCLAEKQMHVGDSGVA